MKQFLEMINSGVVDIIGALIFGCVIGAGIGAMVGTFTLVLGWFA